MLLATKWECGKEKRGWNAHDLSFTGFGSYLQDTNRCNRRYYNLFLLISNDVRQTCGWNTIKSLSLSQATIPIAALIYVEFCKKRIIQGVDCNCIHESLWIYMRYLILTCMKQWISIVHFPNFLFHFPRSVRLLQEVKLACCGISFSTTPPHPSSRSD